MPGTATKPIRLSYSQLTALRNVSLRGMHTRDSLRDWYIAINTIRSLVRKKLLKCTQEAGVTVWRATAAGKEILANG